MTEQRVMQLCGSLTTIISPLILRPSLLCVITRQRLVVCYRRFGTLYRSHYVVQGELTTGSLKMGRTILPPSQKSGKNQSSRGGSLKPRTVSIRWCPVTQVVPNTYLTENCLYPFGVPGVRTVIWRTAWGRRVIHQDALEQLISTCDVAYRFVY